MQDPIFFVAIAWMTALFGAGVIVIVRASSMTVRVLALDTVTLILVALLVLLALNTRSYFFLDVALILALLTFVATLAAARYHGEGNPFA